MVYILIIYLKCLNHRRNRSVQKDHPLFATEQPVPDETALITPITIQLRLNSRLFLLGLAVLMVPATMILLVVEAVLSMTMHLQFPLPLTAIAIGICFVRLTIFVLRRAGKPSFGHQAHIDEQGITVTKNKITTRVDWRTARLFTLNANELFRVYELINDETVVRWHWPLNRNSLLSFYQPVIPQEQYDQQMQALLALVAAKTGLPLYDISKPQKQPAQLQRDLRD